MMKISWIYFVCVALAVCNAISEEDETNELSPPPKFNLDGNLRRALLKALTELENEDQEISNDDGREKTFERASASSVSIYSNSESLDQSSSPSTISSSTSTTENSLVFLQKSEGIQQPSITTIERDNEDSEQISTSSSNSFVEKQSEKFIQDDKVDRSNLNSIQSTSKPKRVDPTTIAPIASTEESEAKVEDVQFFSAPLVAAFTVHQDELGQPKKVESIYKPNLPNKSGEDNRAAREEQPKLSKQEQIRLQQEHEKLKLEELKRQHLKLQQYQQEQKQKALEQEIYRLNLSLRQQEQIFLRQQEELRKRANAQSFQSFNSNGLLLNQPQLPFVPAQQFNPNTVAVQPSLTFDPLVEAGKLPLNAQILPVQGPINFQTPFVTSFGNFNQQPQSTRFFRQNTGTGNFGVNDLKNSNSFSIQQSFQPSFDNSDQSNRFFRSNGESTLTSSQFLQPPQPQNNRFFRSNQESTIGSPSNNLYNSQSQNNNQLNSLLYNSGAFRGKSPEDLNLISKVLSFNHVGNNFENGVRQNQRPYVRGF